MFKAAKREEGGGGEGGVPFHFQQRPVDPADCARRELSTKCCPFFLEFFSESFKMVYKGGIQLPRAKNVFGIPAF